MITIDASKTFREKKRNVKDEILTLNDFRDLGNPADLDYVKEVVRKDYTVVGTLEQLDDTLDLLEAKVPQFFKGIKKLYHSKGNFKRLIINNLESK